VRKWRIYLIGQLVKWEPKMARKLLTMWIKAFGSVELTESGVGASIPGVPPDYRSELYSSEKSGASRLRRAETFNTRWVEGPVCWTVGPSE
jgi:hypothetical protein